MITGTKGVERGRAGETDADHPLIAARDALRCGFRLLNLFKDRPGVVEQTPARIGQLDAACQAMQQQCFDFVLIPIFKIDALDRRHLSGGKGNWGHFFAVPCRAMILSLIWL